MEEETKKILENHEHRIRKLELLFQAKPDIAKKEVSIREFLLSKNPKDDVQKTLVIGYYVERFQGVSAFNSKDLEEGFRSAKERVPDNMNYKAIRNIQKGHMMEAKEKKDDLKAWHLTNSGECFVENSLPEG